MPEVRQTTEFETWLEQCGTKKLVPASKARQNEGGVEPVGHGVSVTGPIDVERGKNDSLLLCGATEPKRDIGERSKMAKEL
jgi:hypothetical protein